VRPRVVARAGVKSKSHKTTKAKKAKRTAKSKSNKTLIPRVGAKVKRVAKKAAVAASLAAIGTALSELQPEQKRIEEGGVNDAERKGGNTSTRYLAPSSGWNLTLGALV
jgi:hypothetical protein